MLSTLSIVFAKNNLINKNFEEALHIKKLLSFCCNKNLKSCFNLEIPGCETRGQDSTGTTGPWPQFKTVYPK